MGGVRNTFSNDERAELTRWFTDEDVARVLLDTIGFDRSRQPPWRIPLLFWHAVDRELQGGAVADGRRKLLAAAAEQYPHNEVFAAGGGVPATAGRWKPDDDDPVTATVLMVDAVGFSKHIASTQRDWRETIYAATDEALAAAGIPADRVLRMEDRGDGYLALADVTVSLATIVADFARELGIALRAHNSLSNDEGRVRLRVAVNQGVVLFDRKSFTSEAVIATARLVDAEQVKVALRGAPEANIAFVISDKVFRDSVAERFRGLDPANFERIDVRSDKYEGIGWLQVDGRRPPPVAAVEPAAVEPATATAATPAATASDSTEARNQNKNAALDFFVSYAEQDKQWAMWIVAVLEDAKYRVHARYLFDLAGSKDLVVVQDGMRRARKTIAVLTPAYLSSPFVTSQWGPAWQQDPQGMERKLVPVRVEECQPDGFLQGITSIDLFDRDHQAAAEHLLEEVRASLNGRRARSPGKPVFPGKPTKR